MFNNLIESSSHRARIQTARFVCSFYHGHLCLALRRRGRDQYLCLRRSAGRSKHRIRHHAESAGAARSAQRQSRMTRRQETPTALRQSRLSANSRPGSVNHPEIIPTGTSAEPNKNPSVPDGVRYAVTGVDSGPIDPGGPGHTGPGGGNGPIRPSAIGEDRHAATAATSDRKTRFANYQQRPDYRPRQVAAKANLSANGNADESTGRGKCSGVD